MASHEKDKYQLKSYRNTKGRFWKFQNSHCKTMAYTHIWTLNGGCTRLEGAGILPTSIWKGRSTAAKCWVVARQGLTYPQAKFLGTAPWWYVLMLEDSFFTDCAHRISYPVASSDDTIDQSMDNTQEDSPPCPSPLMSLVSSLSS
jgi:hypothetical protein